MTVATAIVQERPFPFLLGAQTIAPTMVPFDALIVINPQNDFFPGGARPIPQSEKILKPTRKLIDFAKQNDIEVLVSARSYSSREENHCIVDTYGSELHHKIGIIYFFNKFYRIKFGSQSCLEGYNSSGEYLYERLCYGENIDTLLIVGMPTEECLKVSVLDAINEGFNVLVAIDACRGFDKHKAQQALFEMKKAGAIITTSVKILKGRV